MKYTMEVDMPELVYINPLSAAKITAAVSIVLGFIAAVIIGILGLFSIFSSFILPASTGAAGTDVLMTIVQVVLTTIVLAIGGFILGGIAAFVYNTASGIFGGLYLGFADVILIPEEGEEENEGSIGYE
ncbi:MAG: DUF3566 domain-containing protein [Methanomicrobiaceae archaeon]|nr:DUF3566 domain-containing protein [Methanomicrobiaceae archaeon]